MTLKTATMLCPMPARHVGRVGSTGCMIPPACESTDGSAPAKQSALRIAQTAGHAERLPVRQQAAW